MKVDYWDLLSEVEKDLLHMVLLPGDDAAVGGRAVNDRFNSLVALDSNPGTPDEKLYTLRNFVRQAGTSLEVWREISEIVGVAWSYLEIRVSERTSFLDALGRNGYAVNSWVERVGRLFGRGHPFDSARAITAHRFEPQLHFVNDRADEPPYGANYFFVHWDRQSVISRKGGLLSRLAASRTHDRAASPNEVADFLDRLG